LLYIEHFLCPALKHGQIVMMDNLQVHKTKRVRELIEERGCTLVFLPSYSPDFNPIEEEAFSKVKTILRKAKARSFEALVEATGRALSAVSERDALGFFTHCGYATLQAQSF
jgi:transposase